MKNNYSNIVLLSDLDGTLLNSKREISKENRDALSYFVNNQGKFAVATGRSRESAVKFLDGIPINAPSITLNGGMLYDFTSGQTLVIQELSKSHLIDYLNNVLLEIPSVRIYIYSTYLCYLVSGKDYVDSSEKERFKPLASSLIEDILDEPWIKILFNGNNHELELVESLMHKNNITNEINWVKSGSTHFEILPKGISKGSMIPVIREYVGTDSIIYAVGDHNNDIELIEAADVGIATSNATKELKEHADIVTLSNEDNGIAHVIYNLIK